MVTHCEHGTYLKHDVCLSCPPVPGDFDDPRNEMIRGEREIREWLVEQGHIPADQKDTVALNICRTGPEGLVVSHEQTTPPAEGSNKMSDMTNKVEIQGTVKWEPRVFEPQNSEQKLIISAAIEWVRPKTDNKRSVFHIKAFGDLAEKLKTEDLSEGDVVTVTGSLNESKWKDKKTDEWKNQIEVWATKVEFGERAGGGGGDFAPVGGGATEDDDDIPF